MEELENLLSHLKVFEKMYNAVRVVDPVNKKVLEYVENELREEDMPCYEFWKRAGHLRELYLHAGVY
jgi:hypothetical protein